MSVDIVFLLYTYTVPQPAVVVNITRGEVTSEQNSTSTAASGSESGSGYENLTVPEPTSRVAVNTTITITPPAGSSIKLTCTVAVSESVNTTTALIVEWRKDGVPVSAIKHLTTAPTLQTGGTTYYSELIFPLLSNTRDSANYSCNALVNSTLGSQYITNSEEGSDFINLTVKGEVPQLK